MLTVRIIFDSRFGKALSRANPAEISRISLHRVNERALLGPLL
jgi:hypothetical protein